jgi:hypothetical protein
MLLYRARDMENLNTSELNGTHTESNNSWSLVWDHITVLALQPLLLVFPFTFSKLVTVGHARRLPSVRLLLIILIITYISCFHIYKMVSSRLFWPIQAHVSE